VRKVKFQLQLIDALKTNLTLFHMGLLNLHRSFFRVVKSYSLWKHTWYFRPQKNKWHAIGTQRKWRIFMHLFT